MSADQPRFDFGTLAKADKHLEGVSDATLLILKGQLLIEEALFGQLRQKLPNPEHIEKLNLRFIQAIHLARALFVLKDIDEERNRQWERMWDALEALNAIRNKLAHNLEQADLSNLLRRLQVTTDQPTTNLNDKDIVDQLSITLAFLLAFVSGLNVAEKMRKT